MTDRRNIVAANWKMNGNLVSIRPLVEGIARGLKADRKAEVAICPPAIYVPELARLLEGTDIALGAQNVCNHASGAYTGEIAVGMLQDYGCRYVIVGHSERRNIYGESDILVAEKFGRV